MPVTVTKVNLPERTRARLDVEHDRQRATKPHDIRGAIPLVDYTNPAKFPPYIFREYPKMPLLDGNKPIVIDETGNVLIFYDAADEVDFKSMNEDIAEEIERNTPAKALADAIAAKDQEIDDLRARLRDVGMLDENTKARPKNALAGATRRQLPAAQASDPSFAPQQPDDDLRSTLPPNDARPKDSKPGNPLKKNKN